MQLTKEKWKELLNTKKIFIFDLDGTLIDSVGIWDQANQIVIEYYTKEIVPLDVIRKERNYVLTTTKKKEIYNAYCEFLKDKYAIKDSVDAIARKRKEVTSSFVREKVKFKNMALPLLDYLKNKGYLLALATTTNRGSIDIYNNENINMKGFNFDETFDLVLTKDDVIKKKPNPEVYYKILDYFKLKPSDAIIFEDTSHGVLAGHNANIEVIGVIDSEPNIINESDYYINDFYELFS